MSAVHNSAKTVIYHVATEASGVFTGDTNLGILGAGSNIPDPEALNEDFMGGRAGVGGSIDLLFRILGPGATLSTLNAAADAQPPTEIFISVINKSLTRYVEYRLTLQEAIEQGAGTESKRVAYLVRGFGLGDKIADFMTVVTTPVTLP